MATLGADAEMGGGQPRDGLKREQKGTKTSMKTLFAGWMAGSFLGTGLAMWVTLLCKVQDPVKGFFLGLVLGGTGAVVGAVTAVKRWGP